VVEFNINAYTQSYIHSTCIVFCRSVHMEILLLSRGINPVKVVSNPRKNLDQDRWAMYSNPHLTPKKGGVLISKSVPFSELKVESDDEGGYMIVSCLLRGVEVTLASIYAPTGNPVSLFTDLAVSLSQHPSNRIILGGDWNGVWDPFVDKTDPVSSSDLFIARGLREVSHLATIDVVEVSILNKILSDHSPVQMLYLHDPHLQKHISWRLNNSLLKDDGLLNNLKNEIQNENSVDSYLTIWDAFKATIRGWLISQASGQKTWKDLEVELTKLESLHKANLDDLELLGELKNMQIKIQDHINQKIELALFRAKNHYYAKGDKAGKLLAYRLHKFEMVNQISEIKDSNNKPDGIVSEFHLFYSHLCTSDTNCSDEDLGTFLDNIYLGSLTSEGQVELGKPIQIEEIKHAIKEMPFGKAPGDD
uniref:Endonuclease/exonuclease/phosphatase domain-containing protein n=1 Tax=Latimeria chalumnae TaxID=7897 RepID=H3AEC7_LATCH